MDKETFIRNCNEIFSTCNYNVISKEKALSPDLVSSKIFDAPIIMAEDADHPEFARLKKENIIGGHFMLPNEWLTEAKTIISFFFPFTETIRNSNKENMCFPSKGWMNGRIEGQTFINHFSALIVDFLETNGSKAVCPSIDQRFFMNTDDDHHNINKLFTSNWSERHIAYVCGMGTFSLSKGLITEKGMAGRFTSIITNLHLLSDGKKFHHFEENCTMCGKCIRNCPVNAISFEYGKDHQRCSDFLNSILLEHAPWYGCGKCQVNVPCEYKNPKRT